MAVSAPLILVAVVAGLSGTLLAQKPAVTDECVRTAEMQVYSSVVVHKETSDVLGYDLAVKRDGDSNVDALLYVYEGGESDDGIPLSGQISNDGMSIQGTWVEHLTEYPSKKEIVQERFVEIVGKLDSTIFRGELTIEGMVDQQQVRLKRVKRIWSCKN